MKIGRYILTIKEISMRSKEENKSRFYFFNSPNYGFGFLLNINNKKGYGFYFHI